MDLGKFYLALNVKDIAASKAFYEQLGFEADERWGSVEEKWLSMVNGTIRIGLFQDMLPANVLTFNPTDARNIHQELVEKGVEVEAPQGLEQPSGPCHFMITDPDGNSILIDQHN